MDFKDDAGIDPGSIGSPGGGGGGGRVAIGGGAGVVVLLTAVLLGVNPGDLLGQNDQSQTVPANSTTAVSRCRTGADVKRDPNCRWAAYATSINQYWETQIEGYAKAKTTPFSRSARTGCGHADAQTGPFYCPPDKMVYLDTNFLGTLLQQLGTQSSIAAEAYIMAHEYGHHAQDLLGTLSEAHASGNQTGPKSASVRLELQADCYAGTYLKWTSEDEDDVIDNVTRDDLAKVVEAARAVGDDHIQRQYSGGVQPDKWTHGSSGMRVHWAQRGFDTGDPAKCDTFSTNDLG